MTLAQLQALVIWSPTLSTLILHINVPRQPCMHCSVLVTLASGRLQMNYGQVSCHMKRSFVVQVPYTLNTYKLTTNERRRRRRRRRR
ncbi:hypothetical protein FN846DRAFT_928408 [Sphaerosporella brunnea]|uniref:Secreted protein n=1 Tax=Sphaerosporella brunnea TaxID=1250544 RepID=A0A5J5FAD6_9PEZI|nr:hypothetical protein FN846DRAFT_928408 [Sphaerosporella brunnea]